MKLGLQNEELAMKKYKMVCPENENAEATQKDRSNVIILPQLATMGSHHLIRIMQSLKVFQIFRCITMDDTKTVWCGNLSDQVTEELLYELFLQAGPLERVKIPTDRDGRKSNFAFITFKHEKSVNYVLQLLKGTRLFDRLLIVKQRIGITQNRPLDRNSRQPEFQNNTINQLRLECLPRFDHSTNRFAYNRLNYSGHKRKRIMEDDRLNYNGHKRKKTMMKMGWT
nr:uncharacterized protein LOC111506650 [Leptinotarsa decemlineata]